MKRKPIGGQFTIALLAILPALSFFGVVRADTFNVAGKMYSGGSKAAYQHGMPAAEPLPIQLAVDTAGRISGSLKIECRCWLVEHPLRLNQMIRFRTGGTFQGTFDRDSGKIKGTINFGRWSAQWYSSGQGAILSAELEGQTFREIPASPILSTNYKVTPERLPSSGEIGGSVILDGDSPCVALEVKIPYRIRNQDDILGGVIATALIRLDGKTASPPTDEPPPPGDSDSGDDPLSPPVAPPETPPPVDEPTWHRLTLQVNTDRTTYPCGRRMILRCALYDVECTGGLDPGSELQVVRDCPNRTDFMLFVRFGFPDGSNYQTAIRALDMYQQADRSFLLVPFAPVREGKYTVHVELHRMTLEILPPTDRVEGPASCEFTCQSTPGASQEQIARVIEFFNEHTPPHYQAIDEHFQGIFRNVRRMTGVDATDSKPLAEMDYGPMNNLLWQENGYQCSAYVDKTIRLLNYLRFYHPDTALLDGLHYGPVLNRAANHRAVVLYAADSGAARDGWQQPNNDVLDPWPKQRAWTWKFSRFQMYDMPVIGIGWLDPPKPDPEWNDQKAFPMQGTPVYWNLHWAKSPVRFLFAGDQIPLDEKAPKTYLFVRCPVRVAIVDAQGRRFGNADKCRPLAELAGAEWFADPVGENDWHWYVALPEGEYRLELVGTKAGGASVLMRGKQKDYRLYQVPIVKDQACKLRFDSRRLDGPMLSADGKEIKPTTGPLPPDPNAGLSEAQAVAALRTLGGVMLMFDDRRPGRPVIAADLTNHAKAQDDWLRYLRSFSQLENVSLAGTKMTDAALAHLADLSRLQTLILDETAISDGAVPYLTRMTELRFLSLEGTKITSEGAATIKRTLPWVEIVGIDVPKILLGSDEQDVPIDSDFLSPPVPIVLRARPAEDGEKTMILNVRVENLPEGIEPFYVWRFGDEETVRTEKPRLVHQFPASGRYEVRVGVYYDRTSDHPATIILGETTKRIEVGQPR